jgi:S1-C subfamily serine protease
VKCKECGGTVIVPCTTDDTDISSTPGTPPRYTPETVGHSGAGAALNHFWESVTVPPPKTNPPCAPRSKPTKKSLEEKSPSTFAKGKSTGANPKLTPAPAQTDKEEGWHPALWGLIGGIGVAVAAVIIALVIPRGEKAPARDVKQEESAGQVVAQEDLKPVTEQTPQAPQPPQAKTQLSPEEVYAQASPGVVTITCKNDKGEIANLGSGFFLKNEFVHNPDDQMTRAQVKAKSEEEGRSIQFAYLLTNHHVVKTAARAEIMLSDGSKGRIFWVASEDEPADLALLCTIVFSTNSLTRLPLAESTPRVGSAVYAIGSPRGFANSLSSGIVSSFRDTWLQTTAPISPGSSGGPLLNPDGEVVGVTTATRRDAQNLNFAKSVSDIRRFLSAPYRQRELRPSGNSNAGEGEAKPDGTPRVYELTKVDITKEASFRSSQASVFGVMLNMSKNEVWTKLERQSSLDVKENRTNKTWSVARKNDDREIMALFWADGDSLVKIYLRADFAADLQGNSKRLVTLEVLDVQSDLVRSYLGRPNRVVDATNRNLKEAGVKFSVLRYCYYEKGIEFLSKEFDNGSKTVDLVLVK